MARRKTEVFSLSFLDCITCAFGSVVLVYTLVNAHGGLREMARSKASQVEVTKLEDQVLIALQYTSIRFAALLRIICQRNNGSFVGMHEAEGRGPRFTISGLSGMQDPVS